MGDHMKKTLQAKPRLELEELYQGIPDESVNLTFQDLADVNASDKRKPTMATTIEPISEASIIRNPTKATSPSPSPSPLSKIPSLDFNKGLQASNHHHHHDNNYHHHHKDFSHGGAGGDSPWGHFGHRLEDDRGHGRFSHASGGEQSPRFRAGGDDHSGYSMGYDGMSGVSLASGRGGRQRRPGIPHSKICTICSTYIYLFRTRCLACGRVYCRQCVEIGMGEMTEGRKCVECLGLRFSQRYIERAGTVGCCSWSYPSTMKQTELKWAEKGPRRSGDRGYGHHGMASSRPRTPATPRSPLSIASNEPSFVMSATYSPFSPHNHLPL